MVNSCKLAKLILDRSILGLSHESRHKRAGARGQPLVCFNLTESPEKLCSLLILLADARAKRKHVLSMERLFEDRFWGVLCSQVRLLRTVSYSILVVLVCEVGKILQSSYMPITQFLDKFSTCLEHVIKCHSVTPDDQYEVSYQLNSDPA